jgi:hypothetical protein
MPSPNPNRKPFPRRLFLETILDAGMRERIHPLERLAMEPSIRERDPISWRHTLGAYDVVLDNLGILFGEQFSSEVERFAYFNEAEKHLGLYDHATRHLHPRRPWQGDYLLGKARTANAGEPRPFLRLLAETPLKWPPEPTAHDRQSLDDACHHGVRPNRFSGLPWHLMFPSGGGGFEDLSQVLPTPVWGVPLPLGFGSTVPSSRLLSPSEATPDLPLRVGRTAGDLKEYDWVLRDQGQHPTCTSHAVAMALTLAARRTGKRALHRNFSASWIHYASARGGEGWEQGRSLEAVMEAVQACLPCLEEDFPYPAPSEGPGWRTSPRDAAATTLSEQMGPLEVLELEPFQISRMKTLLAAGWLLVVTTGFPKSWNPGFHRFGLPLVPLPGEARESAGHAWLLVGYDHVDGQAQWKYQGRFLALNSWGRNWPATQFWGPGLCSLPFSFFLTEGLQAYALRFSPRPGTR